MFIQVVPWQTMSTFIFSFISSQILSEAHKYWVCGVLVIFAVVSFLVKIEHIFSVKWYINWYIFKIFIPVNFSGINFRETA